MRRLNLPTIRITITPILVNELGLVKLVKGGNGMTPIKKRMQNMGIKQVDMILELQKRGLVVQPSEMSSILRGVFTYPKAKRVIAECEKILDEREASR